MYIRRDGGMEAAIERCRRNPGDLGSVLGLVRRLRAAGRLEDAFRLCRSMMGRHAGAVDFLVEFADVLRRRSDIAGARQVLERLTGIRPDCAAAWNSLGEIKLAEGNAEAACAAFERALALAPDNADALSNAGRCRAETGDVEQAAGYFKRALERYAKIAAENKGDAGIQTGMAEAYLRLNRPDKALECGKRAVSLAPGEPESWSVMRRAAMQLGDGGGYYRAVVALINGINDDDLAQSIRDLRDMGFDREAEELVGYTVKINRDNAYIDDLPFAESTWAVVEVG